MADVIAIDIPVEDQTARDQEMAKKAEETLQGTPPQETPSQDRPAWLPEGFQTPEDLAKAYSELKQKHPDKAEAPAEEVLQEKGLDFAAFSEEFVKDGGLSEDSYRKLAKAGIPKGVVDQYIEGQKLVAAEMTKAAHAEAGGEESYKAMIQWATTSLSQAEINAFNQAVYSTKEQALLAIRGLHSRYTAAAGSEPRLVNGSSGPSAQSGAFRSIAEMQRAMADPRYKADDAYRQDVINRLAKSNIF